MNEALYYRNKNNHELYNFLTSVGNEQLAS